MRKNQRLSAIAAHLRAAKSETTADELAERFGVSLRTIYRDLDDLREADVPLRAIQGRGGGYSLERNATLPPVHLTAREAVLVVAVGEALARMRWLPLTSTLRSATDKIKAGLSSRDRAELRRVKDGLKWSGVPAERAAERVRSVIEDAWFEGRAVEIETERGRGVSRTVSILGFELERSETVVRCEDADSGETLSIRLHRIRRVTPVEGP